MCIDDVKFGKNTENLLLDTAVLAGELMLKSGAETYRVEDTMFHILSKSNADHIDATAFTTMLTVSLQNEGCMPITIARRVRKRSMNLNRIVRVNEISRSMCSDEMSISEAYQALKCVKEQKEKIYSGLVHNLSLVIIVMGFVLFFGGGWLDLFSGMLVGAVLVLANVMGMRLGLNSVFKDISGSIGIAFSAIVIKYTLLPQMNLEVVIISAIMPLVPGIAITNAVRDTLMGDYLSGAARILEAFMQAAAIAVGIGVGIMMTSMLIGEKVLL